VAPAFSYVGGRRSRPIPASMEFWFSQDKCQDEKKPQDAFLCLRVHFLAQTH